MSHPPQNSRPRETDERRRRRGRRRAPRRRRGRAARRRYTSRGSARCPSAGGAARRPWARPARATATRLAAERREERDGAACERREARRRVRERSVTVGERHRRDDAPLSSSSSSPPPCSRVRFCTMCSLREPTVRLGRGGGGGGGGGRRAVTPRLERENDKNQLVAIIACRHRVDTATSSCAPRVISYTRTNERSLSLIGRHAPAQLERGQVDERLHRFDHRLDGRAAVAPHLRLAARVVARADERAERAGEHLPKPSVARSSRRRPRVNDPRPF